MIHRKKNSSIAVFDSGIGGLTVFKRLVEDFSEEHLIYFGDTARVPYGNKSGDTVRRYAIENAVFLMEKDVKALVVACNTASAYAREALSNIFNIPIVDVIRPGIERALSVTKKERIAVLGTKATTYSGVYSRLIAEKKPSVKVFSIPCPLFVPIVEEGFAEHALAKDVVKDSLKELSTMDVDVLILGCTHYPILQSLIQEYIGDKITIVDSASACADKLRQVLSYHDLQSEKEGLGNRTFFVSDDAENFRKQSSVFLGYNIEDVRLCSAIHH